MTFKNQPGRFQIIKKQVFGRHLTFIFDAALPNISGRRSAPPPAGPAGNIYSLADDIAGIRPDADVEVQSDLNAALCSVSRARDVVVVTGSSRLVKAVLKKGVLK